MKSYTDTGWFRNCVSGTTASKTHIFFIKFSVLIGSVGSLKECVYRDPVPNDIEQLKTNIRNRINDIDHVTLA